MSPPMMSLPFHIHIPLHTFGSWRGYHTQGSIGFANKIPIGAIIFNLEGMKRSHLICDEIIETISPVSDVKK
jgi:hypothetical protein